MGLPKLERQKQEETKAEMRRRIIEKRRRLRDGNGEREGVETVVVGEDGYEADAEDLDDLPKQRHTPNGRNVVVHGMEDDDDDQDGDMMDLD